LTAELSLGRGVTSARRALLLLLALAGACRGKGSASDAATNAAGTSDTAAARQVFEGNIDAIHKRDRDRYLSYYLQTDALTRNGPGGIDRGFADWSARRDTTWPDTLVARDLRLVPVAPGVVYGTYHYRATQRGEASEGISERVFVRTDAGWRIAVSTAFGLPVGASPPPVALVGATLVNPGAAPVPDAIVVVRGGRIVCAAAKAECPIPHDIEVVDVHGGFIGPGLIDAHVHFSQSGWFGGRPDARLMPAGFAYDSLFEQLRVHPDRFGRAYLCAGVTGVLDAGGFPWTLVISGRSTSALDLPVISAAGPMIAADPSLDDRPWNLPTMEQVLAARDDSLVRAVIRANAQMGARAIKVLYVVKSDATRALAKRRLATAASEAHRVGLPLIVHATSLGAARDAVDAGAAVLMHDVTEDAVDDEFVSRVAQRKVIVVPTLAVLEGWRDVLDGKPAATSVPLDCVDSETRRHLADTVPAERRARMADARRRLNGALENNLRNLAKLYAAGVAIAAGSDAGNPGTPHGPSLLREMELMRQAGMRPADIYRSATAIGARAMGREKDLGTLEKGKLADLVVFDADPTADVANMGHVRMVMKAGALYGRKELLP